MVPTLLLIIIYVAFISLGLPDGLLGAGWPSMYIQFNVPLSYMGYVTMIIAGCTIISSLLCDWLLRKIGTGPLVAISVSLTAVGLFGFAFSKNYLMLCLFSLPYGLGAGAVDSALNNYVALHYKSRHMSWLHCFWGVGATTGPYIMGLFLNNGGTWNQGYLTIGIVQSVLIAALLFSLPLWRKNTIPVDVISQGKEEEKKHLSFIQVIKLPGAVFVFLAFFCYCAMEGTTGIWAASYLKLNRGLSAEQAASCAALFYLGITLGRLVSGFVSERFGDRNMIRIGQGIFLSGMILLFIPAPSVLALIALTIIGFGCGPFYPSVIHETPLNFGKENSQSAMGVQMASAYIGSTFMPPAFGLIADYIDISYFPVFIITFGALTLLLTELLNRSQRKKVALQKE